MTIERTDERSEIAVRIRANIESLHRAWPLLEQPRKPTGVSVRVPYQSRPPVPLDPLSLRAEVQADLGFWVRALADEMPGLGPVDLTAVPACLDLIGEHVAFIVSWTYGPRLDLELAEHARTAYALTRERDPRLFIGTCPIKRGANACGHPIRVRPTNPGNIKCRGCSTVDTIGGWTTRMANLQDGLLTLPQLVGPLRQRLGLSVTDRTLRRWHREGRLVACGEGTGNGTKRVPLFNLRDVMAVLVYTEAA